MIGAPVFGSTARMLGTGVQLHRVPTEIVMRGIAHQIAEECEGDWYACVMFENGDGEMFGISQTSRRPPEEILELMFRLAVRLNKEVPQGGHWITAWSSDRLFVMWRNRRGEMVTSIGFDEPWPRLKGWSDEEFMDRCAQAFLVAEQTNHEIDKKANDAVRQDSSYRSIRRH